ncbi:hypothetical protein AX15_002098, partial [Amanita polypyramis BW_CC]
VQPIESVATSLLENEELKHAWDEVIKLAGSVKLKELSMYKPIAKFLNLLVNPGLVGIGTTNTDDVGTATARNLMFIPWDHVTGGVDEGERFRQDIIAVDATPDETREFLAGDLSGDAVPQKYYEPGHLRIYYFDIRYIVEEKASTATPAQIHSDMLQLLKYFFTASQYQSRHAAYCGILAYRNGFKTVHYFPDITLHSRLYQWDELVLKVRVDLFSADVPFTTKSFCPSNHRWQGKIPLRLQYHTETICGQPNANTIYQLYDIFHGHGWTRNAYVGLGIPAGAATDSQLNGCRVFKHSWHDMHRSSNELDIYIETTMARSGVQLLSLSREQEPELTYDHLLKGIDIGETQIPERIDVVIAFKTIGESLANCSSVKQFLMAMCNLVEVHRTLVEDHGLLHRDIGWFNVLVNAIQLEEMNGYRDDFCGRPFIDDVLNVPRGEQKVHVTLADFDCARFMKRNNGSWRGELTGTPMFMSSWLCGNGFTLPSDIQGANFSFACVDVYGRSLTKEKFNSEKRVKEVSEFISLQI